MFELIEHKYKKMIRNLSAEFIDKIFADYPTLENLNLSHNGNTLTT